MHQGGATPLYVLGRVGKEEVFLEVDSGADRSIISRSDALRLGVRVRKFNGSKDILGVGGKKIPCREFAILNIQIQVLEGNDLGLNILFYVLDLKVPNLLGSDVMAFLKAKIDYENKILTLLGRGIELKDKQVKMK